MMNQNLGVTRVVNCGKTFTLGLLVAGLVLVAGAVKSQATVFYWVGGSDTWSSPTVWTTNGATGPVGIPQPLDDEVFTNAATYTINLDSGGDANNATFGSNDYANAAFTSATITFNCNTFQLSTTTGFIIGDGANSTTTVWIASNTLPGIAISSGTTTIGRNGIGTLIITNGGFSLPAATAVMGNGNGGVGKLVVSGPTSSFVCNGIGVGAATNAPGGSSIIVSNSALFQDGSSFRMGSGSNGGSVSNMFIFDSNGHGNFLSGHAVIGKRGGTNGAFENGMIVKNGASAAFNNHSLAIGWSDDDAGPGTNNFLTIMSGCAMTNISVLNLRHGNFLNLYGGTVGGDFSTSPGNGNIQVDGIFQGYGAVKGSMSIITNGTLIVSNTVAPLTIQHDFLMTTNNAVLQMALGTSFNTTVVNSNIMLSGKLNLIDGGGFASTTYTLISYSGKIIYTNVTDGFTNSFITVGTTPDNSKTYTIDTNTAGQINLIVSGVATLPFQITSITRSGANITVNWNTKGSVGQTNFLQASPGTVVGHNYPGTFVDIATNIIAGTTATFTDVSGVTGATNKYYRVRSPQ
jgi:hypothetical protein